MKSLEDISHPINISMAPTNVVIATMDGKCEISLQGTIGTTVYTVTDPNSPHSISNILPTIEGVLDTDLDKWRMNGSMSGHGTPYIHAHCTASNKDYTVCGHLMPGTRVASGDPTKPSHFSVVIAKVTGVELQATFDEEHGFYQNIVKK